jgi:hypothetical protein
MMSVIAGKHACADCNRSNKQPSEWTIATQAVCINKKWYLLCEDCFEVSKQQAQTDLYTEWLDRSNHTVKLSLKNVCGTCVLGGKITPSIEKLDNGIFVCKYCKDFCKINDAMLTYCERDWLDELYAAILRRTDDNGIFIMATVYK